MGKTKNGLEGGNTNIIKLKFLK